jgi:hypothetical protein
MKIENKEAFIYRLGLGAGGWVWGCSWVYYIHCKPTLSIFYNIKLISNFRVTGQKKAEDSNISLDSLFFFDRYNRFFQLMVILRLSWHYGICVLEKSIMQWCNYGWTVLVNRSSTIHSVVHWSTDDTDADPTDTVSSLTYMSVLTDQLISVLSGTLTHPLSQNVHLLFI